MISNFKVKCEDGFIRASWRWEGEPADFARIYYAKDKAEGSQTVFQDTVIHQPGVGTGCADKILNSESGIYNFTIVPVKGKKDIWEKSVSCKAVLGKKLCFQCIEEIQNGYTVLRFKIKNSTEKFVIPEGAVYVKQGNYYILLNYEITPDTRIAFPCGVPNGEVKVDAIDPYNQIYKF